MGTRTYANRAQKTNKKKQDITPIDKNKKTRKKIINLSVNKWPTFQENIKRMYSTEIKQTESSTKTKSNANTNEEIPKENSKVTVSANEKRQRSPIRPPDINRDIIEKTKDTTFKKHNSVKRITQPTPITTSNKFEEYEEIEIENKTPQTSKSQNKKSHHSQN